MVYTTSCVYLITFCLLFIFSPHSDLLADQLIDACISSSDISEARRLLDKGVDPNHSVYRREYNGSTPLHTACIYNNHEQVQLLVERGADVEAVYSIDGHTPLHDACDYGSLESINVLLAHHSDPG